MIVPNTLHLNDIYVSEDLRAEIEAHPICEIVEEVQVAYDQGRHGLEFVAP